MRKQLIAKTKKGQEIIITPVFDKFEDYVSYQAEYNGEKIKLGNTDFQTFKGKFVLQLNSHQINRFFDVELPKGKTAAVIIEEEDAKQVIREEWPSEHSQRIIKMVEKEISSMNDNDPITLYAFSGYGMPYTLECEKLGYRASRNAAERVETILGMFPHQPAPEKNSDVAYKVELTWGEYRKINDKMDEEEAQKEQEKENAQREKFEQAKKTGKPVLLYKATINEEDLPKHEREEESSVAFVSVFAMPDGSKKQEVSHAY